MLQRCFCYIISTRCSTFLSIKIETETIDLGEGCHGYTVSASADHGDWTVVAIGSSDGLLRIIAVEVSSCHQLSKYTTASLPGIHRAQ